MEAIASPGMIVLHRYRLRRADLLGWGGAAVMAATLAASWWWILFLPLGDSHDGRINGRFAIHVRNFFELGPFDSGLGSSLTPLAEGAYAHHPPLINALHVLIGGLLGRGEWQLHLIGWLGGIATVLLLVGILRQVGVGWPAALAAMALTAATPMFWIYARLGFGMAPGLFLVAVVLRERTRDGEKASPLLLVAVVVAVAASWPTALLAALLTGWMFWSRRRVAADMAVAGVITGLVVIAWILQATDLTELRDHTAARLAAPVGLRGYLDQYRFFYTTLFPAWYLWLMVPALVAGFVDHRVRPVVIALTAVGLLWTAALPEAAYVHDYWTYPLLGPVTMGAAVLIDWAASGARWRQVAVPGAMVLLGAVSFVALQRGPFPDAYFVAPSEAGRLLQEVGPVPGQQVGYVAGPIALPRWMTYYWDVDAVELTEDTLEQVDPDHLVLIRTDLPPAWAVAYDRDGVVATAGRYALVEADALQR